MDEFDNPWDELRSLRGISLVLLAVWFGVFLLGAAVIAVVPRLTWVWAALMFLAFLGVAGFRWRMSEWLCPECGNFFFRRGVIPGSGLHRESCIHCEAAPLRRRKIDMVRTRRDKAVLDDGGVHALIGFGRLVVPVEDSEEAIAKLEERGIPVYGLAPYALRDSQLREYPGRVRNISRHDQPEGELASILQAFPDDTTHVEPVTGDPGASVRKATADRRREQN